MVDTHKCQQARTHARTHLVVCGACRCLQSPRTVLCNELMNAKNRYVVWLRPILGSSSRSRDGSIHLDTNKYIPKQTLTEQGLVRANICSSVNQTAISGPQNGPWIKSPLALIVQWPESNGNKNQTYCWTIMYGTETMRMRQLWPRERAKVVLNRLHISWCLL